MHLQENMLFDIGAKVTRNVAQYPRHHVTYAPAKFDVARRYTYKKIHYLALTLGSRSHEMLPSKFEVTTSNGLEGKKNTKNVMDAQTHRQTNRPQTNFGKKLIFPFFLKKKVGIMIRLFCFQIKIILLFSNLNDLTFQIKMI